jgi:hypothetical protein
LVKDLATLNPLGLTDIEREKRIRLRSTYVEIDLFGYCRHPATDEKLPVVVEVKRGAINVRGIRRVLRYIKLTNARVSWLATSAAGMVGVG